MKPVSRNKQAIVVVAGAVALVACSSDESKSSGAGETTAAKVEPARAEALDRLDKSARVLNDTGPKIPDEVASRSKCVLTFPSIVKAGLVVGGQGGKGYATCVTEQGGWSAPAPISIGGGTLGAQVGAQSTELVALVDSDTGKKALLSGNFKVGVDASASAGPVGTGRGAQTGDIVSYSRSEGLYAGANIDGTTIKADEDSTNALYGKKYDLKALLGGSVAPPAESAAQRFLGAAQSMFGAARKPQVSSFTP